jgi:hypothetical protein
MPADEGRIGRKLVDALKNSNGSGRREVEVDHDGATARARVRGSGPYGSSIDELTVVRPGDDGGDIEHQADDLVERLSYLPERVRKHEIAPALGGGILRSEPDEMRNREYQEIGLQGGHEARVRRYRYDREAGERRAIPQNYAHETLERLTDDLADVLGPPDDETPEP